MTIKRPVRGGACRAGDVLEGKYRLVCRIGQGGMAVVWLAEDLRVGSCWAVKEIPLPGDLTREMRMRSAAWREIECLSRLNHPAIPRIVDRMRREDREILVMDYVQGESLAERVKREGSLAEEEAVALGLRILEVLRYLHSRNPPVYYLDLKPANVILTPEGSLRMVDFGAAVFSDRGCSCCQGTPGYAPPEQCPGGVPNPDWDLYAAAKTLEFLLGERGKPAGEKRSGQMSERLSGILSRATAEDPADRYRSAEEMENALRGIAAGGRGLRSPGNRRRWVLAAVGAAALVILEAAVGSRAFTRQERYRQLLSLSPAAAAGTRESACMEAIGMRPERPEGYLELLDIYREDGIFSETESERFLHVYDSHKDLLAGDREGASRICSLAGEMYFFLYGGEDGDFRTRLMKALPFYENVEMLAQASDAQMRAAHRMCVLGRFYRDYRSGMGAVREIRRDQYEEVLASFAACLGEWKETDVEDSWRILRLMQEMIRFVGEDRRNMIAAGVSGEELTDFLRRTEEVLAEIPADRDRSSVLAGELREELRRIEEAV